MSKDLSWTFFNIWNNSLVSPDWELKPRNYIWASELGGAYIDRFLKMKAVEPTNPPNARSHRKFQAGFIWEWIVELILKRAGLIIMAQEHITYQYDDLLEVTGRPDFLAGGTPDWEKAEAEVKLLGFPLVIERASLNIIQNLKEKYQGNLKEIVLEVKSCSSMIFDRYERTGVASYHHTLQLYHYLKALNLEEGHIVYICRDDCRMIEIGVFNPSKIEEDYKRDITLMTEYYESDRQPSIEPEILFDPIIGKIQKNWKVEYSNYLKMLYGYDEPEAYRNMWDARISSFNRVLGRIANGANMTAKNLDVIKEMKALFPNYQEIETIAKEKLAKLPEEELEDGE